jgi:nicotinate phosphoribosyltransferase
VSVGGRKYALRRRTASGRAQAEVIGIGAEPGHDGDDRPLLVELVRDGERVHAETLDDARRRLRTALAELPPAATQLSKGDPVLDTVYEETP